MGGQVNKPLKIVLLIVGAINLIIGIAIVVQFIRELIALDEFEKYLKNPSVNKTDLEFKGGSTLMWSLGTSLLLGVGCILIALKPHIAFSIVTVVLGAIQIVQCIVLALAISNRWFQNEIFFKTTLEHARKFDVVHLDGVNQLDTLDGIYHFGQTICGINITVSIVTIVVASLSLCKRCTSGGGSSSGSTATF